VKLCRCGDQLQVVGENGILVAAVALMAGEFRKLR